MGGTINRGHVADVEAKGHTVVRGLAPRDRVDAIRPVIEAAVLAHAERMPALEDRDTYGKAFLQVGNLWETDPRIAEFVFDPAFAEAAAALLGVERVRLYHDQALCKEPGGGFTPWHQDQVYWPLDTTRTITMWMPLVDVAESVGSMTFANGSHLHGELSGEVIGDASEAAFDRIVAERGMVTETHGAVAAGDATFHTGWTLHRAPANTSSAMRSVMTVIYYDADARVGPLDSVFRRFDAQQWLDGIDEGAPAAGSKNPVLWPPLPAAVS